MFGQKTTLYLSSPHNGIVYLCPPYKVLAQIFYFKELYDKISGIDGDIVECGVAYGGSLYILGALAKQEGKDRKIYGLDSFEGFPEPTVEDLSEYRVIQKGEYNDTSTAKVKQLFHWADLEEPTLIKGFIEDTAGSFKNQVDRIAFLHIDTDLYNSYKFSLNELFDKVAKGGLVLFDEYDDPKFPGATKAVDEFFAGTSCELQKIKYMDKYKFFVIKK